MKTFLFRSILIGYLLVGLLNSGIAQEQKKLRLLFIGNSLTYSNDLPALVKELGEKDGYQVDVQSIVAPGYSLEDHWTGGVIQKEITKNRFDYVIVQQGPSAMPDSKQLLTNYVQLIANVCKQNNTKLAVFMVWPSKSRLQTDLDKVIESYTYSAKKAGALLCPAGLAWKMAWELNPDLPLYTGDDFHPSLLGSFLSALTIYASIQAKNNLSFVMLDQLSFRNEGFSEKILTIIKNAATKSLL